MFVSMFVLFSFEYEIFKDSEINNKIIKIVESDFDYLVEFK